MASVTLAAYYMPEQLTHINTDGVFVKLWGVHRKYQLDYVRNMIELRTRELSYGFGQLCNLTELIPGKKVLAIYNEVFQRAKIVRLDSNQARHVIVNFIDLGVVTSVDIGNIRICVGDTILDGIDKIWPTGLANDFILYGAVARGQWTNEEVELVNSVLKRTIEFRMTEIVDDKKIIQVYIPVKGQSNLSRIALSTFLVRSGLASQISEDLFTDLLRSKSRITDISATNSIIVPTPSISSAPLPSFDTKTGQNRSSGPNITPINSADTSQSSIPPTCQQINVPNSVQIAQLAATVQNFVHFMLPADSMQNVVISHVEDGMNAFVVQLKKSKYLDLPNLVAKINNIRPEPITDQVEPGTLCLGRFHQDSSLRRAIVCNILADGASLYFVDFGCTGTVPFKEIYKIPPEFVQEPSMALQFAIADLTNALSTPEANSLFTNIALRENLIFQLKVVEPLVPTQQRCELFIVANGKEINVKSKILDRMEQTKPAEYKKLVVQKNDVADVTVRYSDSPIEFFVQLKQNQATLDVIIKCIEDLRINSENEDGFLNIDIYKNRPVLAPFKENKYCRALIIDDDSDSEGYVTVFHVDYGDYDIVYYKKLRFINPEMVTTHPAQAIKCRLDIDPSLITNPEVTNAFTELTDCENFKMSVKNILLGNVLVDLVDQRGLNVASHLFETFGAKSSLTSFAPFAAPPKRPLQNSSISDCIMRNSSSMVDDFFSPRNERSLLDNQDDTLHSNSNYIQSSHNDCEVGIHPSVLGDTCSEESSTRGNSNHPRSSFDNRERGRDSDGVDINDDASSETSSDSGSKADSGESRRHDKSSRDQSNDRYSGSRKRNRYRNYSSTWRRNSRNNQDENRESFGERRFKDRFTDRRIKTSNDDFSGRSPSDNRFDNRSPRRNNRFKDSRFKDRISRRGRSFNDVQKKPYSRFSPPSVFSSRSRCKHESDFNKN